MVTHVGRSSVRYVFHPPSGPVHTKPGLQAPSFEEGERGTAFEAFPLAGPPIRRGIRYCHD